MTYHSKSDLLALNIVRAEDAALGKIHRQQARQWFKQAKRRAARGKRDETFLLMEENGLFLTERKSNIVRMDTRARNVAFAFLRGVPYVCVEQKTYVKSFAHRKPKAFWKAVAEEAAMWGKRLHVESQKNLHMYEKAVYAWRDEHPGAVTLRSLNSKYEQEKDGAPFETMQRFLSTYGDVWLWL